MTHKINPSVCNSHSVSPIFFGSSIRCRVKSDLCNRFCWVMLWSSNDNDKDKNDDNNNKTKVMIFLG